MNIFILDYNVDKCAEYHNDRHVVKMILETAQILSTVANKEGLYKPTHKNHPCTLWATQSEANFEWLAELGLSLGREYTYRFSKIHKSVDIIQKCLRYLSIIEFPNSNLTEFALAMPMEYKTNNAVESYRNYYLNDKRHLAKWTKRGEPEWWI